MGTVYIVGAGPGDPSLITMRGLRYLEAADVVVHDHRVQAGLLRRAPAGAERIDVGAAAPKPLEQDAICLLLVEKAREGKVVVRLKWGDPFVFDSGGKEALFLHEHRIPFEVVPGVPAAIGGPAYAGVPVTYPEAGDVLSFVRGHEGETDGPPDVDWSQLAGLGGTIVCFAGARQIGSIARALMTHGRRADETAALIYDPTLPAQSTIAGTLGDIGEHAHDRGPALLVVGRVAGLREHLRWYDDRPLFGRRIVVTRAREQAGEFIDMLEERGAQVIASPAIRIVKPEDIAPLDRAAREASSFDWIIFTSGNGVDHFMQRLLETGDVRELKGVRICTVGPSTAARLERYGIRVDLTPPEYRADAVLDAMRAFGDLGGARVLLPRADIGREVIGEELRGAGADVLEVIAYRTIAAQADREGDTDVYRLLLDRQIDAVTFTSASTVRGFVGALGAVSGSPKVVAIGPVTARAARAHGLHVHAVASPHTVEGLVAAVERALRPRD